MLARPPGPAREYGTVIAKISDAMMREQTRTADAFWRHICEHKELPPRDSVIMRHLARAWACDPPDVQHSGLCNRGIGLIREAVWGEPDAPPLADAIAAFEIWLRAKDAYRATFLEIWEMDEALRSHMSERHSIADLDPSKLAYCSACLRIERALYMRHRYKRPSARERMP